MEKIIRTSVYVFLILFVSVGTFYGHANLLTIDEQIDYSDIIVIGEIVDVKKTIIGYKYGTMKGVKDLKHEKILPEIRIKYGNAFYEEKINIETLKQKHTYLFFLKKDDDNYIILQPIYDVRNNDVVAFGVKKSIDEIKKLIEQYNLGQ